MKTSGRSCQLIVAAIKPLISLQRIWSCLGPICVRRFRSVMAIGSLSLPSGSTYPFSLDPAAATVWESDQILASLLVHGGRPRRERPRNVWRQQRIAACGAKHRRRESGVLTPRFSGNLTGLGFHAAHRIASCYPWPPPPSSLAPPRKA